MELKDVDLLAEKNNFLTRRRLNLDDVFKEYIGEGGKYQLFIVVILAMNAYCSAGVFVDILWVADPKPHWCALPDNANPVLHNLSLDERLNLTVPWITKGDELVRDSCNMYDLNYSSLTPQNKLHIHNTTSTVPCSEWEFDTSEFNGTIVEKVLRFNINQYSINCICYHILFDRSKLSSFVNDILVGNGVW